LSVSRTFSIYAKQNTLRYLFLSVTGSSDVHCYSAIFDLQDGVVSGTKTNGNATLTESIEDVGNGWYRCIISGTMTNATANYFPLIGTSNSPDFTGTLFNNNAPMYAGDGSSIYIYGAQIEQGSYPTSYIPTYGTSQTRSLDSCVATSVSDLIGQGQGTMFFEIDQPYADGVNGAWSISDGSSANRLTMNTLDVDTTTFTLGIATNYAGGSTKLASVNKTYGSHKVAIQYSGTSLKLFVDGALADSVTTDGSGNYTNFYIGGNQQGVGDEIREFKQAVLFPTALTDSECIALTS